MDFGSIFGGGDKSGGLSFGDSLSLILGGAQIVSSLFGQKQAHEDTQMQLDWKAQQAAMDRAQQMALQRESIAAQLAAAGMSSGASRYSTKMGAAANRFGTASDNARAILAAKLKSREGGAQTVLAAGQPRVDTAMNSARISADVWDRIAGRLQSAAMG